MNTRFNVQEGSPYPRGATLTEKGTNFALFSANADKVEVCLFDEKGEKEISRIKMVGYTDQIFHVFIEDVAEGALYGYRVYGPYDPLRGHRFNHHKLLQDPYARRTFGDFVWCKEVYAYDINSPQKDLSFDTHDNSPFVPKSVVTDKPQLCVPSVFEKNKPHVPWHKTILYETHVRGFTQLNFAVPTEDRGTYAGLANSTVLEYIKNLGVTAIELLPVHGFIDEEFLIERNLQNYWGYNSIHFFAPHNAYSRSGSPEEFRAMVDAAHAHGLEVILDVVYNHTAEGNHLGPTISFRGIDNASYYMLEAQDKRFYANDTGCGNTLNLKNARVLQLVLDSLRYWATDMGVDGFRFDLATVLGRENYGFDSGSGFFDAIRQDPMLARCKLIAEPWDIGPGGYQLGNYPSGWSEWNDRYRDTCRRFWVGERGMLPEFARRIHGSSDIFEHGGRSPSASINFITSHDGFTLTDLVSYNNRHNLVNTEENRDGHNANYSSNYGEEGDTDNPGIIALRQRQRRNLLATLFLSQGTPMLLAGDELGRTQRGNNNAYCQNNEISWLDWDKLTDDDKALQEFVKYLIYLRQHYYLFTSKKYIHRPDKVSGDAEFYCQVRWISASGNEMKDMQWMERELQVVGWVLERKWLVNDEEKPDECLLLLFNASEQVVDFSFPQVDKLLSWDILLNTNEPSGKLSQVIQKTSSQSTDLMSHSIQLLEGHF